jgi:hypothetical protein
MPTHNNPLKSDALSATTHRFHILHEIPFNTYLWHRAKKTYQRVDALAFFLMLGKIDARISKTDVD